MLGKVAAAWAALEHGRGRTGRIGWVDRSSRPHRGVTGGLLCEHQPPKKKLQNQLTLGPRGMNELDPSGQDGSGGLGLARDRSGSVGVGWGRWDSSGWLGTSSDHWSWPRAVVVAFFRGMVE